MSAAEEKGFNEKMEESLCDKIQVDANPPKAGPKIKPSPNAMPTRAIPLDLAFREVTSAIAAVATDKFPLATPPRTRDKTKTQKSPAKIHKPYPKAVPPKV